MHIEFRHLRTIKAIHDTGGLARAADQLNITQSALSHQIKGIEDQAGVELFVRRSKPLKLSAAGLRLLKAAEAILPQVAALEAEFEGLVAGKSGRLHIAIECHACFEWLFPVLEAFRKAWPDVDVDIRPGLAFDAMPALRKEEVDLVVSSDPEDLPDTDFTPLFDYEPVFLASANHPLAQKAFIEAEDFRGENLISAAGAVQFGLRDETTDQGRDHPQAICSDASVRHEPAVYGPPDPAGQTRGGQTAALGQTFLPAETQTTIFSPRLS